QFAYWDFPRLAVAQIPWLTANQLSTIKDNVQFGNMSDAQRAALTVTQVRQLDANNVGIYLLTELQRGWLSTAQLQSLAVSTNVLSLLTSNQISQLAAAQVRQFQYWDFPLLSVSQIPILTAAQIQSIPGQDQFRRLSEAQRGALSVAQVRSLNVGGVGLALLTPLQRQWISAAQVQTLLSRDFALLTTAQLSLVTPQQFASVANASDLDGLSEQQRRALSSEQILSLPLDLLIRLTGADIDAAKLAGFTPMNRFGVGPDGLSANPHAAMAWQQVLSLVPVSQATHTAVASGEWTDPRIWSNGQVPGNGANVMIPAGIDVQLSEWLAQPLKTVRIDGSLTFNPDAYTQLMVDTIVVNTTGSFHMGTESEPINEQRIARVLFPTAQALDTTWDPRLLSRGLISRGEVRVYGAEKTSFTTFATPPQAGDTVLTLAEVPLNWQVGDRLKLAGTQNWQDDYGTEEVVIRAISGSTVTVDALKFDHQPPAGYELQAYVANMTRNAQFSASHQNVPALQRPHLMFMQNPNVELVDAGVYGLGRTDKSEPLNRPVVVNGVLQPGTGTNPEARYAVHFHHTGVDPNSTPGLVRGTVVDGSPGWGFVNHQSYVIMEDNVAYGVDGAAFVGEDGNEIGAFRHNLAMSTTGTGLDPRTRKEIGDFGHSGDGFWLQGPLIETTGNISAGARHAGFTIFAASSKVAIDPADIGAEAWTGLADVIPVSAVPVANFSDNIAFAGNRGLETWFLTRGLYDLPANGIDNFTAWGNRGAAIQLEYSTRVTINGGTLLGTGESGARGVSMNVRTSDVTYNDVTIHDFEIAAIAASRGVTVFRDGSYRALTGIEITVPINEAREVSIVGNPVFARPTAAWAAGKPSYDISMNGELDLYFQSPETMVASQVVAIDTPATGKALLYYLEQAPGHVPFPSATTAGYVPTSWLNLKNGELQQRFGVSFAGEMIPNSAVANSRIWGKLLPLA
ncbi:MAG: hypothetical protein CMJ58_22655, partial [Planctomycetaceae bacterium]|nr:hypothetical protein [Planctomycetaceae bacterium]